MSIITRMLKQIAVYWAPLAPDKFGKTTYAAPVEITCRWEQRDEEFKDRDGSVLISPAVVYVGQDVVVGGMLMLGELTSSVDETNPRANAGAWEIGRFDKLPTLRATRFLRTVYLMSKVTRG